MSKFTICLKKCSLRLVASSLLALTTNTFAACPPGFDCKITYQQLMKKASSAGYQESCSDLVGAILAPAKCKIDTKATASKVSAAEARQPATTQPTPRSVRERATSDQSTAPTQKQRQQHSIQYR
jgi:hypothetical protein